MTIELSPKAEEAISGAIAAGTFPNAEAFIEAAILNFLEEQNEQQEIEGWSEDDLRSAAKEGDESGYKPYKGMNAIIKNA